MPQTSLWVSFTPAVPLVSCLYRATCKPLNDRQLCKDPSYPSLQSIKMHLRHVIHLNSISALVADLDDVGLRGPRSPHSLVKTCRTATWMVYYRTLPVELTLGAGFGKIWSEYKVVPLGRRCHRTFSPHTFSSVQFTIRHYGWRTPLMTYSYA